MYRSWAVTIKVEHEYNYDENAVALNTIKVERQVKGNDDKYDAAWAAVEAVKGLRDQYCIKLQDRLHVVSVKIREVE